ncbi:MULTISPECIES: aldo/keto reductase family protein [unclassified Cytobacillus]|uniref:aldo/keto reductase family protein n=1 Tax=unclassified Cytobacillus TaxID=2675268 RepID=UPI00135B6755|nr:aldo/keto reductase family protein [Cytobacillus sp. AMY 15.2]KAF0817657.1 Potassium channel beta chain [Bacillus sp. ZZV12-4809]MCM3092190.1 aldo/keto reductase family protein [Cytobacillus sp. AMY 15.2]
MEYRLVGNSGLEISEIGLGTWLTFGGSLNESEATNLVTAAMNMGINYFDTANVYPLGMPSNNSTLTTQAAEIILGKALKRFSRDSYVVSTKAYFSMGTGPNREGLSRKHLIEQCNESLRRLNLEYIDIYYCHRFDPYTPIEETLMALDYLIRSGKVLYVGVCNWDQNQLAEANEIIKTRGLHPIITNQLKYNMFDRDIEEELLPFCEEVGIGITAYSPLANGVLSGKYKSFQKPPLNSRASRPETQSMMQRYLELEYLRKVEKLNEFAIQNGMTLPQLALAWNLRMKNISSCIVGATSAEQLSENTKGSDIDLSDEDINEINLFLMNEKQYI